MNNALLNQVLEVYPDPVAMFGPDLVLVMCNQAFTDSNQKHLGITLKPGDNLKRIFEAWPSLSGPSSEPCVLERVLAGERCTRVLFWEEKNAYFDVSFTPMYSEKGTVDHIFMISRDITAEMAARQNEKFIRNVLENLPVGLQQFTPDGWSTDLNEAQRRILGEDHAAVRQQPYNVLQDPFNRHNGLTALLEDVLENRQPQKREMLLKYVEKEEDGVTHILPKYYDATGFPVMDRQGEVASVFLILNEITDKKLAVLSLEKSERLLHTIVENLPVGYIQFDNFGFIRRVNQTQRRFFTNTGMEEEPGYNMIRHPFAKLFELDQLFLQVLQTGSMIRVEKKLDFSVDIAGGKMNREIFLDLTIFPVEDPVDRDQIVVALVNDITEKKRQEIENAKTQAFLLETGEIGKIGGWDYDMDTRRLRWSPQAYKIHELPPYAVMTLEKAMSYYSEDSVHRIKQAVDECVERGKSFDLQVSLITARNNKLQVRAIGKPEYRNGRIIRIYGVIQDVTEQYRIRDQLTRNAELMRLFFDTIDMGYAVMDKEGRVSFINRKAQEIVDHGMVIGRNIFDVFPTLVGSTFHTRVQQCIATQSPVSFYNYLPAQSKWYEFLLAPMQDGNISIFTRNITDSKKMQRELRKANDQLSSLNKYLVNQNKQLEDFAHITSHNLRAPIANLKALTQIINEADGEADRLMYQGMFQEVIRNIDETLNDLIEVVQIRKDLNVEREQLIFAERMQKIRELLFVDIESSGIRLTTDFDSAPAIEYPRIYLDSILQNLLTNAIRYRSPDRTPAVHFRSWKEDGAIILTAEDNGQGIDMERYGAKLFGFRKTFHKNKEAKGIGLFITKSQIEAMGGSIHAESAPGAGTKFIITFRPE